MTTPWEEGYPSHLPSGVFTANAAWLVLAVMAFNLTRAAATIADTSLANHPPETRHRPGTDRPPSGASHSTCRKAGPGKHPGQPLFGQACGPPASATT